MHFIAELKGISPIYIITNMPFVGLEVCTVGKQALWVPPRTLYRPLYPFWLTSHVNVLRFICLPKMKQVHTCHSFLNLFNPTYLNWPAYGEWTYSYYVSESALFTSLLYYAALWRCVPRRGHLDNLGSDKNTSVSSHCYWRRGCRPLAVPGLLLGGHRLCDISCRLLRLLWLSVWAPVCAHNGEFYRDEETSVSPLALT